jgi:hypothetical protein
MASTKLTTVIDDRNNRFTLKVKDQLKDLEAISEKALEWLMTEHFQFSVSNPGFLKNAAKTTEQLANHGVAAELYRNFDEESGHAAMYRKGLAGIGTDVDSRAPFGPTGEFLERIRSLTTGNPSRALGAMYATETAAIFEHEIFWEISREVCRRRRIGWEPTALKAFHDLHLDGVEQSHKDELGVFVDPSEADVPGTAGAGDNAEGKPIDTAELLGGAEEAIAAMAAWWEALVEEARAR